MTHIIRAKAQAAYLFQRGEPLLEADVVQHPEKSTQAFRLLYVALAETGVYQDQAAAIGFD